MSSGGDTRWPVSLLLIATLAVVSLAQCANGSSVKVCVNATPPECREAASVAQVSLGPMHPTVLRVEVIRSTEAACRRDLGAGRSLAREPCPEAVFDFNASVQVRLLDGTTLERIVVRDRRSGPMKLAPCCFL